MKHVLSLAFCACSFAQELPWPPILPGGVAVATDTSGEFLKPGPNLRKGVQIAKTPPTVDFLYYPGQNYPGNPWSVWGEGLAHDGKYYSAIGDHKGIDGNAFLYEYDAATKKIRLLADVRKVLNRPEGHYTPGKIHSRIDLGRDGWLYYSTHRGSTRITTKANHFTGGWILRTHPGTGKSEVVSHAPLPMQTLPASVLDSERMIFYAGTADGDYKNKRVMFLAYDVAKRRVIHSDEAGFARYAVFAKSTGRLYYHDGRSSPNQTTGPRPLVYFDPTKPSQTQLTKARVGLRAATQELANGKVYTIDHDELWEFDTKTETARSLGPSAVASKTYTTSIDADHKTGRYLYYIPGAHGGGEKDGSPLVQYDLKKKTRKVIAFLHPFYHRKYGYIPQGTFGSAVSANGDKVFVTWNGNRGTPVGATARRVRFNTCALMVIHIPPSERQP
ncbi:MAG: hypothetical protein CMJ68_07980 [Planctomycetaceae bacterium]|nr:hypothetical protein [Planctomycetaceae bacterium]|tara:strand:+ start:620 stop:1954 length:1335 start_codon:yes stop_codon:yes gene_type:complete